MPAQLDPTQAAELLRRQDALQAEAEQLIAALDLLGVLGRAGPVRLIGSFVSSLMVWRDLDLQVLSPGLSAAQAWDVIRPLATHPRVHEVRYIDESGSNTFAGDPRNARYYFQVYARMPATLPSTTLPRGAEPAGGFPSDTTWKLDVSFWLFDDPREDEVTYLENLARRLDPESRLAILWIKSRWVESPERRDPAYGRDISGVDIYDAVLQHGVRTPDAFDTYLIARGKPPRTLNPTSTT